RAGRGGSDGAKGAFREVERGFARSEVGKVGLSRQAEEATDVAGYALAGDRAETAEDRGAGGASRSAGGDASAGGAALDEHFERELRVLQRPPDDVVDGGTDPRARDQAFGLSRSQGLGREAPRLSGGLLR